MSDLESSNDPIDARARAASASLIDSFGGLDVEADLEVVRRGSAIPIAGSEAPRHRRRFVAIASAAAAVLVGGIAVVVLTSEDRSAVTNTPVTAEPENTEPVVTPSAPQSTAPEPTSTAPAPETTIASTTPITSAPPPVAAVSSVSYLDPPPLLQMTPLATIEVPIQPDGGYGLAIGDLGVAVNKYLYSYAPGNTSGGDLSTIEVIGFDGQVRSTVDVEGGVLLAYGPGDVVYLTRQEERIEDFAAHAVALSGPNAGTSVRSELQNINLFIEYPPMSFGHGRDGLISRRPYLADEPSFFGHVGVDGQAVTLDPVPPAFQFTELEQAYEGLGGTITSSSGMSWTLEVEAAPDRASPFDGPSPPGPSADDRGVYVTHIGPNADPSIDFGIPTMWVIAELRPDGTANWWSIPDGWSVAATDAWGTVLVRQEGTQLTVALADFSTGAD